MVEDGVRGLFKRVDIVAFCVFLLLLYSLFVRAFGVPVMVYLNDNISIEIMIVGIQGLFQWACYNLTALPHDIDATGIIIHRNPLTCKIFVFQNVNKVLADTPFDYHYQKYIILQLPGEKQKGADMYLFLALLLKGCSVEQRRLEN